MGADKVNGVCDTLAKAVLEKKDWGKDGGKNDLEDSKTIAKANLDQIFGETQKRIIDLSGEYTPMIDGEATVKDDIKNELKAFVKKAIEDTTMELNDMIDGYFVFFAAHNSKSVHVLSDLPSKDLTQEKITEEQEHLHHVIVTSCSTIVRSVEGEEVDVERAIQNELIRQHIKVPTYLYGFRADDLPSLNDDLSSDEWKLITDKKTKEAVAAIVKLAQDELSAIVQESSIQVANAQSAFTVNIVALTKLSAEEKAKRTQSVADLIKKHEQTITDIKAKIATWSAGKLTQEPKELQEFLDATEMETQDLATSVNEAGQQYFTDLEPFVADFANLE